MSENISTCVRLHIVSSRRPLAYILVPGTLTEAPEYGVLRILVLKPIVLSAIGIVKPLSSLTERAGGLGNPSGALVCCCQVRGLLLLPANLLAVRSSD